MSSETDVMNVAASKLGARRISSRLDEGKFPEEINARYDDIRDAELRRNRWRFALARKDLPALSSVPVGNQFSTEYQLPADCLQLVQVGEFYIGSLNDYRTADEAPFSLEGRKILTDLSAPLFIRYVTRVTDTTQMDSAFVQTLGARCAYELAMTMTGSAALRDAMWADYQRSLNEAILANAVEVPPQPIADDSWVLARIS